MSQEQSLDEDAVFLPVTESSPEFLHCEKERRAVERLLSAGPEAFYSSIDTERSGCFLSSEEVSKITSWAQIYRCKRLQMQRKEHGEIDSSEMEDSCSTYFPSNSDVPTPNLELGWPEKSPRVTKERITVHTSPPIEGEPPIREIIRRNLQKANKVIAIVTDRLTDGAIIGDLHNAASRGVPVYVILNQRSIQENFTLNRLRHPNMQVRVLGGKTFCSRTGRMVVGEMKDKFLLIDLEIAIHGSYSLTWTDAHLHRQLITVLSGSVVDSFDQQFRILYAASFPVPDTWRAAGTHVHMSYQLKDLSNISFKKHLPLEPEITSPPSPPADSLLDWEAMGVVQRDHWNLDSLHDEMPLQKNTLFDENTPIMDNFTYNGHQFVDERRLKETTSPVTNAVLDNSTTFNYIEPSLTDLTPERKKRVECVIEKAHSRQVSTEESTNLHDRTKRLDDKPTETTHNMAIHSFTKSGEHSRREPGLEEKHNINETMSKVENTPSSRKPLILRVPQSETLSSLSDIIEKCQPQQGSPGQLQRGSKTAVSELSQSMMDLTSHSPHTNDVRVPRFKANKCFDRSHLTPGFALMKKRNDDLKHQLYSTPKNVMPRERPQSACYTLDWRRSLAEREGDQDTELKK